MKNNVKSGILFKSGDCNYNTDIFSNFSLHIYKNQLTMDMLLVRPLRMGLKGHVVFNFRLGKAQPYRNLFHHDFNYCAMLKGARDSMYGRFFTSMLKVGNFATSCPIGTGNYYLHDWALDSKLVPSFLQIGDYRIDGSFYYGNKKQHKDNTLLLCTVEAILD
ncbi:uncharacterized protein LOC115632844 [Scaptodrosophila lebanonensis]|uniref:Uncharacterized protein LOC115632844 n=1 Tax=Drosophila lebanonensis TaxID=7225 RepID=A0A6J2UBV3_DROLE|nr:uncharacterized protein LOC115632844 [Scaptodrosophila lebanonensis]